jgi:hypothetical protein
MSFATIFNSTRVRVTSNWIQARVNEPPFTDVPASAIFIGARNDDIIVQKNKIISASGNGIDLRNTGGKGSAGPAPTNVVIRKNKVAHTGFAGIDVAATGAGEYQVLANHSRNNTRFGIHFATGTTGGTVTGNTALDNGQFDCRDESTGPANTWTDNIGRSANPRSICAVPTVDDHDGKGHDKKHKKHHKKKTKKHKKHRPDPCKCTLPWRF